MAELEGIRKLEAILAADVAGYSRLMQDDDEATVATLETYRAVFCEKSQALTYACSQWHPPLNRWMGCRRSWVSHFYERMAGNRAAFSLPPWVAEAHRDIG